MQTTWSGEQPWHLHLVLELVCLIGFVSLLKLSSPLFSWVLTRFVLNPKPLKSYGSWALVTGATDGIGRAFAHELARHGLHLILVSRNRTKLESVSQQFQQEFPNIRIKIVPFDFSSDEQKPSTRYKAIEEAIRGVDVGILINNVGITYPKAMFFHEVEEETWREIIRVNVEGTTWVTRHVLAGMLQRRRGAIVNMSSGAGVIIPSHPLFAIYAATKCYIDKLSRCLHVEYKQFGIDVQCQVPLQIATRMVSKVANVEEASLFIPSPEMYAKSAVKLIGIRPRCSPYWGHSLQWFIVKLLPEFVVDSWRLSIGSRRRRNMLV